MKVWLVIYGDYGESGMVLGVFSKKESAEALLKKEQIAISKLNYVALEEYEVIDE
jgi:hypothetical protein